MLGRFIKDEEGLTSVEYAILLGALVVTTLSVWHILGRRIRRVPRRAARFWPRG